MGGTHDSQARAAGGSPFRVTLLAILVAALVACSVFPRRITYRRAGVVGSGTQGAYSTRIRYYSLEIGDPGRPPAASPVVILKLPDGTTLRTDRLDVARLRKLSTRIHKDPPLRSDRGWPMGMEEICVGDYSFFAVEGTVVSVLVGSGRPPEPSAAPPEIGDAQGRTFYRFPLTHKQLIRLFGKPESLSKDLADPL